MNEPCPNGDQILDMACGFMPACVLGAAAELDLFSELDRQPATAAELAERLSADVRGLTMLLDAVTALRLLYKESGANVYSVPVEMRRWLIADSPDSVLPMILHRVNIMRGWSQLAWVAKEGHPARRQASIRGEEADRAAFIAAMHTVSGPVADAVVARLGDVTFSRLLDVGGASGTWTLALLRKVPTARAVIFDLPDAIQQAERRVAQSEFADRIELVAGDFYRDDLPADVDFAWVSAIAHQHSRRHNRELFSKVARALIPGGTIALRDIVMQSDGIRPTQGAMFAINMLVNTETGGTYTFDQYAEDLIAAGWVAPRLVVQSDDMNSIITASKAPS